MSKYDDQINELTRRVDAIQKLIDRRCEKFEQKLDQLMQKLSAHEADIEALKQEQTEATAKQPDTPVVHEIGRVVMDEPKFTVTPAAQASITMPTDDELRQLAEVVWRKYPGLKPKFNGRFESEDWNGFWYDVKKCFAYIARMKRTTELDQEHSTSWWADNVGPGTTSGAFIVAAIASSDVLFSLKVEGVPNHFVGLNQWNGTPAREGAFRDVLAGHIREPVVVRVELDRSVGFVHRGTGVNVFAAGAR